MFWAFPDERQYFWIIRMVNTIDFECFRMILSSFGWYLLSILSIFGLTKIILKPSDGIFFRVLVVSDDQKHFWDICMVFAMKFLSVFEWRRKQLKPHYINSSLMKENTFEAFEEDGICYRFWAFPDERKYFWSIWNVFAINFKRFIMNKTILKPSECICYQF